MIIYTMYERWIMCMDQIITFLSRIEVIIAILAIILILIIYLIVHKVKLNGYKKELGKYEVRYNSIKSVPLAFKLNKAVAIAKVDSNMNEKVSHARDDFDQCQNNLRQIAECLADIDDNIVMGKTKLAKNGLLDLESSISLGENQVSKLNEFLDSVLEKETAQRQEVTILKEKFRLLKQEANDKSSLMNYSWAKIDLFICDIEKGFSAFEEWMYASDFEKATEKLTEIKNDLGDLENIVNSLPGILQKARYTIPNYMSDINKKYLALKDKGVFVSHLQIETNINTIATSLKSDLDNLKDAKLNNVVEHLEDYQTRLNQLNEQLDKESLAYKDISKISSDITKTIEEARTYIKYIKDEYEKASIRFGIENLDEVIKTSNEQIDSIIEKKTNLYDEIKNDTIPSSVAYDRLQEMLDDTMKMTASLKDSRDRLASAKGDEERANKQLLKLQLIMNEMQVKIRTNRLPSISTSYEDDLNKAYEYIGSVKKLIDETPLNVQLLNTTLNDAIDFIYKLWNNVNNVVGTAIMVENTIVFGNKYRSTYSDIDSELTRAELCFRNGEYTQALKIAIATIEKIHPGSYEKLIKENAGA